MIKFIKHFFIGIIVLTLLNANTRISFSRPGSILRTPGKSPMVAPHSYRVGSAMELLHTSVLNYAPAVYFHALNVEGYNFGISYFSHAIVNKNSANNDLEERPSSLNISVDKQVFNKDNMTVSVGVHDILYDAPASHRLSLFANFSHYYKINDDYDLETTLGFGSGYLSEDSHDQTADNQSPANFFTSIKIITPILKKYDRGLILLAEYDGWGLNMGVSIPVSKNWIINTGLTHFENISKFDDWNSDGSVIGDAPAIIFGFEMLLPSVNYDGIKKAKVNLNRSYGYSTQNQELDSLVAHANSIISNLEDTLMLQNAAYQTLQNEKTSLKQKINSLADSLNGMHLENKIFQENINQAMKYLSQSLEGYYAGDYISALSEVDKALSIYPDLAISYARKGSIYYKMGDTKRATINSNLALKLDPEYLEVRNILINLKNKSIDLNLLPE